MTAPTLVSATPADDTRAVPVAGNFVLRFSEPVQAGIGSIVFYNADGSVARSFDVRDTAQVRFNGAVMTIDPSGSLLPDHDYYVGIAGGVVIDNTALPYAGISGSKAYSFRTMSPDGDDYASTIATQKTLGLGEEVHARIDRAGDRDVFRVSLQAGQTYVFSTRDTGSKVGSIVSPTLLDSAGRAVAYEGSGRADGALVYTAHSGGTYYLAAAAQSSVSGVDYRPLVNAFEDDYSDDALTAGRLRVDREVEQGVIDIGIDVDRFKVDLQAGVPYRFTVGSDDPHARYALSLLGPDGRTLASASEDSESTTVLTFLPASGGTYFVSTGSGSTWSGSTYHISAQTVVDDHPAREPGRIDVGTVVDGVIDYTDDSDRYAVQLEAGVGYRFELRRQGDPFIEDPFLSLYDAAGKLVASNDDFDGGSKARINLIAQRGGTYYLEARDDADTIGGYALEAMEIDLQAPRLVALEPADDAREVSRSPRLTLTFDEPVQGGRGPMEIVDLRTGVVVWRVADASTSEQAWSSRDNTFTVRPAIDLPRDGGFALRLGAGAVVDSQGNSFAGFGGNTAYNFRTTARDDFDAFTGTRGVAVADGRDTPGVIEVAHDRDLFKVSLLAGEVYRFSLSGGGASEVPHPRLTLYDASLALQAATGGAKSSVAAMEYAVQATGVYYLEAEGLDGGTGSYTLRALQQDRTPPRLVSMSPADGARGIARSSDLVLTFDEEVTDGGSSIELQRPNGDVFEPGVAVTFDGRTVTLNPNENLDPGSWRVVLAESAIVDMAGNAWAGLANAATYDFTASSANRSPTAAAFEMQADEGTPFEGAITSGSDPDGDTVQYAVAVPPAHGTLDLRSAGDFTYRPATAYAGPDSFVFEVRDKLGGASRHTATIVVAPMPGLFVGTEGADRFAARSSGDIYHGMGGNDVFEPGPGNDSVDGGDGVDTVILPGARRDYTVIEINEAHAHFVHPSQGEDWLSVERLRFDDVSLALDVQGYVGVAVRVVGTVFGKSALQDRALVGRYVALADQELSDEPMVAAALADPAFLRLAGSDSNADLVRLVYQNVVGVAPNAEQVALFAGLLDSQAYSRVQLVALVSSSELVYELVDIIGLTDTGIEYSPA